MSKDIQNTEQSLSYRGIFKATSMFGGVQFYQILMEIIKSKFIAVLLGPMGVGIQGLYSSGIQMIQQLSSLGLSQSAVRNVAEAYASSDMRKISSTVTALRRIVWVTGLLGMLTVILLSPVLSNFSFGNDAHVWGFVALSVTLLFAQINAGQKVVLQGTRRYKYLAKCSVYGVTIGLVISIPLYYLWGIEAIIPNLIISALILLILSCYFSRKVQIESVPQTFGETLMIGKTMLTMGVAMCLSQVIATASAFILRSCIRMWGGVDEVGLYTAGFMLMTQYTGLVFSAMSTDFYPRLAAVNYDNQKCKEIMNQQGEIGLLLIAPLLVLCIVFIPIVVVILYSEQFLAIESYIIWCAVGMMFKMASWTVSYIFIAKAESKLFMTNEMIVGVYSLLFSLIGYKIGGLNGLGIAFMVSYMVYLVQVYLIASTKYSFRFNSSLVRIFTLQFILILLSLACVYTLPVLWKYIIGLICFSISVLYTLYEINKRVNILQFLKNRLLNKHGK